MTSACSHLCSLCVNPVLKIIDPLLRTPSRLCFISFSPSCLPFPFLVLVLLFLTQTASPITEAYKSAYAFTTSSTGPNTSSASAEGGEFARRAVTRTEYAESGSSASRRKFQGWKSFGESEKDVQSHKDAPNVGTVKDTSQKDGTKGRGRHYREDRHQANRGDDHTSVIQNHGQTQALTAGGRAARTRNTRV